MTLNINHHAAAYGLFHLAYAVLDGRVRHSLFLLRKSRDASIKPEKFQQGMFGNRLEELRKELELFRDDTSLRDEVEHQDVKEEVQALEPHASMLEKLPTGETPGFIRHKSESLRTSTFLSCAMGAAPPC